MSTKGFTEGSTRVERAPLSEHAPLFAAVFVVALLASPVLAMYELLLGLLGGFLTAFLPGRRGSSIRRKLLIVSAAVLAAGLTYAIAGLTLNLFDAGASGEGGSSKPPPG